MERVSSVIACKNFLWTIARTILLMGALSNKSFCSRYPCLPISRMFWLRRLFSHIVQLSSTIIFRLKGNFHYKAAACELTKMLGYFQEKNYHRFCWIQYFAAKQIDWWNTSTWCGFQLQGLSICRCPTELSDKRKLEFNFLRFDLAKKIGGSIPNKPLQKNSRNSIDPSKLLGTINGKVLNFSRIVQAKFVAWETVFVANLEWQIKAVSKFFIRNNELQWKHVF